MHITQVTRDQALQYWPTISTILERARETGQDESSLADYMTKILTNNAQCWVVIDNDQVVGAGLTEVLLYPQYRTLHIIVFAGGDFEQQAKVFPTVEAYAKEIGCVAVEQWGRRGWAKTLPKHVPGFEEVYTVMRKKVL